MTDYLGGKLADLRNTLGRAGATPLAQTRPGRRPGGLAPSAHARSAPKLTAAQRVALPDLLAQGAEAFGFTRDLWTNPRIAALIETQFGVRDHPAHISRLLRQIGWTSQNPITRATQRDEAAIATWEAEHWPALKKGPKRKDARLSG